MLFNKLFASSLGLLAIFELCSCAPQSYYSSYYFPDRTLASRANPYRRANYSPYRDYNREYYDALKQRRMRALANSYRGIHNSVGERSDSNGNSKSQRYYSSSRLPAVSTAISTVSNDDSSTTNNNNGDYNNYKRNEAYASSNNRQTDSTATNPSTNSQQDAITTTTNQPLVSKADEQNAKFVGIRNQEANDEDEPKTLALLKLKKLKKRRRCLAYGRNARGDDVTPPPEEQGRILWDLNVYNIYSAPQIYGGGGSECSGFGGGFGGGGLASAFAGAGGLGGGGLFADPIEAAYAPPNRLNNFLQFFAPGILQNALAATARPAAFRPQADTVANELDPDVDPNYTPVPARPAPVRRPNRVYYDSAGAPPVTPAQLVGGVATTVNGIIQQLTGNVQPVYPSYRSLR